MRHSTANTVHPGDRVHIYMAAGAKDGPLYQIKATIIAVGDRVTFEPDLAGSVTYGDWITGWELIPEPWIDPDVML